MMVIIRIESRAVGDPFPRYHGMTIDKDLKPNFWKTQKDEWMVLKELQWENGALNIDLYRLYDPGSAKNLDMLKLSLKELGNLKSEVIFNVNFIDSTKLERVVLTLNVPSN